MNKIFRITPLLLLAFFAACGQKVFMNVEEIPVPAEARPGPIEGRYETPLDNATNTILGELKQTYGKTEEKILYLPPNAQPEPVFAFYEQQLAAKGFRRDETVPASGRNYHLAVWRRDGWIGGEAVAAAVIDAGQHANGDSIKFLAVYTGAK